MPMVGSYFPLILWKGLPDSKRNNYTRAKMCGRCASARNSEQIRHACSYRPRGKPKSVKPAWISHCSSLRYQPCYNLSPQMNSPVLISSEHAHIQNAAHVLLASDDATKVEGVLGDRVLQPMKWGLVPAWRRGDQQGSAPLLNNCRLDGISEKPSFRNAMEKRRRCVVLADGFYEWHRTGKQKRPYFIHFKDNEPTVFMKELEEESERFSEGGRQDSGGVATCEEGCVGDQKVEDVDKNVLSGRMLTMAGLFDICVREEEPLFTYTIITVDAHQDFSHIHDRMPAVLDGEAAIGAWLDSSVSSSEAIKALGSSPALTWYPVSEVVNNVRNRTSECIQKIDPSKEVSRRQKTLASWFTKSGSGGVSKSDSNVTAQPPQKKPRKS